MTIPVERTRAVQKAHDFLRRVALRLGTKGVPSVIREEASMILRHFPCDLDLYLASKESDHFDHPDNTGMINKEVPPKEYLLKINERQAQLLVDVCDLYSRIGIGQIEEIVNLARHGMLKHKNGKTADYENLNVADHMIRQVKLFLFGLESNANYGIHNETISDMYRVAWDLQQVIRQRLAWDRRGNPQKREWGEELSMMGVHYDEPHKASKEPLPKIERSNAVELMNDLPSGYAVSKHNGMCGSDQKWHLFDMSGKEAKWLTSGESIESLMNWIEQNPKKA